MVGEEATKEIESGEGLISRHLMASSFHGGVSVIGIGFSVSSSCAIDEPRLPLDGLRVRRIVQFREARLRVGEWNSENINVA